MKKKGLVALFLAIVLVLTGINVPGDPVFAQESDGWTYTDESGTTEIPEYEIVEGEVPENAASNDSSSENLSQDVDNSEELTWLPADQTSEPVIIESDGIGDAILSDDTASVNSTGVYETDIDSIDENTESTINEVDSLGTITPADSYVTDLHITCENERFLLNFKALQTGYDYSVRLMSSTTQTGAGRSRSTVEVSEQFEDTVYAEEMTAEFYDTAYYYFQVKVLPEGYSEDDLWNFSDGIISAESPRFYYKAPAKRLTKLHSLKWNSSANTLSWEYPGDETFNLIYAVDFYVFVNNTQIGFGEVSGDELNSVNSIDFKKLYQSEGDHTFDNPIDDLTVEVHMLSSAPNSYGHLIFSEKFGKGGTSGNYTRVEDDGFLYVHNSLDQVTSLTAKVLYKSSADAAPQEIECFNYPKTNAGVIYRTGIADYINKYGSGIYYVQLSSADPKTGKEIESYTSYDFVYTEPEEKLESPSSLSIDEDYYVHWEGMSSASWYVIKVLHNGKIITRFNNNVAEYADLKTYIDIFGSGTYEVQVIAVPVDITSVAPSDPATASITITKPATGITLSRTSVTGLYPGDSFDLTATVGPEDATDGIVDWKVIDAYTGEITDNMLIYSGEGASANSLSDANKVRVYALYSGSYKVRAYINGNESLYEECTVTVLDSDLRKEEAGDADHRETESLKIYGIEDKTYDGKPHIQDNIRVYYGEKKLTLNRDYKLSYKNNVNAGSSAIVVITPMGNFSGDAIEERFTIEPIDIAYYDELEDESYLYFDYTIPAAIENGKVQKLVPDISAYGFGKLKGSSVAGKGDFTYSYPDEDEDGLTAYKDPGQWRIKITGNGNFTGTGYIYETIAAKENSKLISKVNIKTKSSYTYDELTQIFDDEGSYAPPELTITDGNKTVYPDQYRAEYVVWPNAGKKSVIRVTGTGETSSEDNDTAYYGSKDITINVTGTKLTKNNVVIEGLKESYTYTGELIYPTDDISVKVNGTSIGKYGDDRAYWFVDNAKNVGTAKLIVQGQNGYIGTVTKTFKITPADISAATFTVADEADDSAGTSTYSLTDKNTIKFRYRKGGAAPTVIEGVDGLGNSLTAGTDYTVKYTNNKKVGDTGHILITGKGNYKGSTLDIPFTIINGNLNDVTVSIPDKQYKAKSKTAWKSVPVLIDTDGKKLSAGTDYEKITDSSFNYNGKSLGALPYSGSVVTVNITGKGNYAGSSITAYYKIVSADYNISKADFKIADKQLSATGSPVELNEADFTKAVAADKKTALRLGDDFVIAGYTANTKKGTAKVILKGCGAYGGTKTVSFKITARSIK